EYSCNVSICTVDNVGTRYMDILLIFPSVFRYCPVTNSPVCRKMMFCYVSKKILSSSHHQHQQQNNQHRDRYQHQQKLKQPHQQRLSQCNHHFPQKQNPRHLQNQHQHKKRKIQHQHERNKHQHQLPYYSHHHNKAVKVNPKAQQEAKGIFLQYAECKQSKLCIVFMEVFIVSPSEISRCCSTLSSLARNIYSANWQTGSKPIKFLVAN
ncbi:hypothetical protein Ahia01_000123800, partial [Argonauta hians]